MASWDKLKKAGYVIKEWNESNCNLDENEYVRKMYDNKRYAFVSDYFRLKALYDEGGIYFDTDVEVFKPFDKLLNCKLFMGFIFDSSIGTAVIGAEKGNPLMLEWMEILKNDFCLNGDVTINNDWITKYFLENFDDFLLNGRRQSLSCGIELYPKDWFERYHINKKNGGGFSEHHCAGSWSDSSVPVYKKILKAILPRALISYMGHKAAVKNSTYAEVYYSHKNKKSRNI